jgi:hypothetical protein
VKNNVNITHENINNTHVNINNDTPKNKFKVLFLEMKDTKSCFKNYKKLRKINSSTKFYTSQ